MTEAQKIVFIVVNRADCERTAGLLNARRFTCHTALPAHGTAPSETLAWLGLGEREKSLILCFAGESRTAELFGLLKEVGLFGPGGGIAFSVRISGIAGKSMLDYIAKHE